MCGLFIKYERTTRLAKYVGKYAIELSIFINTKLVGSLENENSG